MRRQGLASANLTVFAETNSFKPSDPQYAAQRSVRLPVATADSGKLIRASMSALGQLWRPGYRYKKAGVMLLDLVPAAMVGDALFDAADDPRSQARMKAVDELNRRFGRGSVGFGTAGERQRWTLRREFHSPRYTTLWRELLSV